MSSGSDIEVPKVVGYAVSIHNEPLTIYPNPLGPGEVAFTSEDGAGPYYKIAGCPNCGERAGWWDQIALAGAANSNWDPNDPCSRACRYELEWRAELASRQQGINT